MDKKMIQMFITFFYRAVKTGMIIFLSGAAFIAAVNIFIYFYSSAYITSDPENVPQAYTAIVPGALVMRSGNLSHITYDRAMSAVELYKSGKVKRILVSGDHGTKKYDEVNTIRKFLLKNGVAGKDIFLDHAGFDTYSTMTRADKVFCVTDAVIVTQKYHLYRALFIARMKGLDATGYAADKRHYVRIRYYKLREIPANMKAFYEVVFNVRPKYLGEKIPVTGDSSLTLD
ncbi:MAG: YdcF family protein [Spirochaetes bacterium]|nr:YdcF family protein [Spirochaetota bacterium]